ncbi:Holliday junction resolvase RuvX [Caldichromatium japonicum]|uniref:Putative pre-16S rRNA nuclease n=1 Tax=Caldichromatium japonicum TaxID=2699430 RepID=A0A6G7VF92_9GAMM|nr:Holliday junction resolvase RuvX [Caldichromatium japonicum]QIK38753.1 Holliday junction resolvase RuvX [Caldichromatium japonicum]
MTFLGFDFGPRKIGVAVGQGLTRSATPLITLRAQGNGPDWLRIGALIREWRPHALIVGLPFNMDDTEMDWSPQVHAFAAQLGERFGLPVHLIDERLTSREAWRQLAERDRRPPTREAVDALAAALILETWLSEYA